MLNEQIFYCRLFRQYLLLLLLNQVASSLFRFIAAASRNMIIANTFGTFALLLLFALGGFVLSRGIRMKDFFRNCRTFLCINPNNGFLFSFCIWSMLQKISRNGGFGFTGLPL